MLRMHAGVHVGNEETCTIHPAMHCNNYVYSHLTMLTDLLIYHPLTLHIRTSTFCIALVILLHSKQIKVCHTIIFMHNFEWHKRFTINFNQVTVK